MRKNLIKRLVLGILIVFTTMAIFPTTASANNDMNMFTTTSTTNTADQMIFQTNLFQESANVTALTNNINNVSSDQITMFSTTSTPETTSLATTAAENANQQQNNQNALVSKDGKVLRQAYSAIGEIKKEGEDYWFINEKLELGIICEDPYVSAAIRTIANTGVIVEAVGPVNQDTGIFLITEIDILTKPEPEVLKKLEEIVEAINLENRYHKLYNFEGKIEKRGEDYWLVAPYGEFGLQTDNPPVASAIRTLANSDTPVYLEGHISPTDVIDVTLLSVATDHLSEDSYEKLMVLYDFYGDGSKENKQNSLFGNFQGFGNFDFSNFGNFSNFDFSNFGNFSNFSFEGFGNFDFSNFGNFSNFNFNNFGNFDFSNFGNFSNFDFSNFDNFNFEGFGNFNFDNFNFSDFGNTNTVENPFADFDFDGFDFSNFDFSSSLEGLEGLDLEGLDLGSIDWENFNFEGLDLDNLDLESLLENLNLEGMDSGNNNNNSNSDNSEDNAGSSNTGRENSENNNGE